MMNLSSIMQIKKNPGNESHHLLTGIHYCLLPCRVYDVELLVGKSRERGRRTSVIHGKLIKLLHIIFYKDINLRPTILPNSILNSDEEITILYVWESFFHTE